MISIELCSGLLQYDKNTIVIGHSLSYALLVTKE